MPKFPERLKKHRKDAGYTQESFATRIGVQTRRYAHWEQGAYEPPMDVLALICTTLDLDANYMLGIVDDPKREEINATVLEEIKKLVSQ